MADAATEFLLNNLKDILENHAHLIKDTNGIIENLVRDLGIFKAFLRGTVKMRKENERTNEMVKEIHDVVYEVEDIIDVFVTKTIEKRNKSLFSRFWSKSIALHSIGTKVEEIKGRVERAREELNIVSVDESKHEKPEPRPPRKNDVVGFEEVTEDLISRLIRETDHFDVISLIGTYGLGKTTVAWKIFNDPRIVDRFPIRIWLPISQQFTEREIFLNILKYLTTINDDIYAKANSEIAELVAAHLQTGSFLIVLDDVWTRADWDRLCIALPYNAKGKVLITSRNEDMGKYASSPLPFVPLRFFKPEESWELFRLEALGKLDCPRELNAVGRKIAEDCDGLPLAIVVIGGILATMYSASNIAATQNNWEEVSKYVSSYYRGEKDPANRIQKLISLSYDELPCHLRACFLYLGLFPEEIPVSKLIRMWIGEGFIQQNSNSDCSPEETGEKYLEDLINRNLVKSVKFKPDGKVKTCQIHDTLRDFCRSEAEAENFLQEIKFNKDGQCVPSDISTYRRLSIHSNYLDFISSKPFGPCARSFVCFSKDKHVVTAENSTKIIGAFKLLKIFDVLPFKFTKIDSDLYNLVHMRYMALSSELSILPSDFSQLSNIQTLIVETTSRTLEVKADIWKMNHLRHFKTNASAVLSKSTKRDKPKPSAELQTLGTISVESCTEELSDLACNLKKLGIRGNLALLFDRKKGSFDSLGKIKELGKLKLMNDAYPNSPSEGGLHCLPEQSRFPSGLTSLTLSATYLSWDHMPTLGLLQKLKVLKLKDHAFMGSIWVAVDGGFQCLEFLYIEKTDLFVWNASSHHYPKLRGLVLQNCEKLLKIPIELAHIQSLNNLELHTCISAAKSAREIWDAKKKTQEGFMLSIYPPIE